MANYEDFYPEDGRVDLLRLADERARNAGRYAGVLSPVPVGLPPLRQQSLDLSAPASSGALSAAAVPFASAPAPAGTGMRFDLPALLERFKAARAADSARVARGVGADMPGAPSVAALAAPVAAPAPAPAAPAPAAPRAPLVDRETSRAFLGTLGDVLTRQTGRGAQMIAASDERLRLAGEMGEMKNPGSNISRALQGALKRFDVVDPAMVDNMSAFDIQRAFPMISQTAMAVDRDLNRSQEAAIKKVQAEIAAKAATLRGQLLSRSFKNAGELMDQYRNKDEDVGDTFKSVAEYNKLSSLANDSTGASDVQMIYAFAKMMDPRGAVRDSDADLVKKAAGYLPGLGAQIAGLASGVKFSPETRRQIVESAKTTMNAKIATRKNLDREYITLARDSGLNPTGIIYDWDSLANVGGSAAPAKKPYIIMNGKEVELTAEDVAAAPPAQKEKIRWK